MPTRMYSSVEFIHSLLPLLQALTALGKADERNKCNNGHQDDKHIKHAVPPHLTKHYPNVRCLPGRLRHHRLCAARPPRPAAAGSPAEMAWGDTPVGGTPPVGGD